MKLLPATLEGAQTAVRILSSAAGMPGSAMLVDAAAPKLSAVLRNREKWETTKTYTEVLVGTLSHASASDVAFAAAYDAIDGLVGVPHKSQKAMRKAFFRAGGVKAALDAMLARPGDEEGLIRACRVLWEMCRDGPAQRMQALKNGAIDAITEAMRAHAMSLELQRDGGNGIAWLCHAEAEICAVVADKGALLPIVEAMRTHRGDLMLQAIGTDAFGEFCQNGWEVRAKLGDVGGIEVVRQPLVEHAREEQRAHQTEIARHEWCSLGGGTPCNQQVACKSPLLLRRRTMRV